MDLIRKRIEGIPFIEGLPEHVEKEGGSVYLTDKVSVYIRRYAEKQEPVALTEKFAEFLRNVAKAWNLVPRVQAVSGWALKHGYIDQGLDLLAEELWGKAAEGETRKVIVRYLEEIKEEKVINGGALFRTLMGLAEKSDGLNIDEAADSLQVELHLTLRKLKDPENPLRVTLKNTLLSKIDELEYNTQFADQIERWKNNVLNDALFSRLLETVLQAVMKEPNALYQVVHHYIEKYWVSVQDNRALQERINLFIADTLCLVIQNEHDLIGCMVRETLAAYTDQDLNQFIEEKAGNDLQWIRINGSMIGGVVGLILFLLLNFVYDPIIKLALMNYIPWNR